MANVDEPGKSCLCINRVFTNLKLNKGYTKILNKYIDMSDDDSTIDKKSSKMLTSMKENLLPELLPEENIVQYQIDWDEDGINPDFNAQHKDYMISLLNRVEDYCMKIIDNTKTSFDESESFDLLSEDIKHHARILKYYCQNFRGRRKAIQAVEDYLRKYSRNPLVIHGPIGSGKSAVMAMAANITKKVIFANTMVIIRFIGRSPESSSVRSLINSLCQQICKVYGRRIIDVERVSFYYFNLF